MNSIKKYIVNIYTIIILSTPFFYFFIFFNNQLSFSISALTISSMLIIYMLSHFFRAIRLYVLTSQENITLIDSIKLYFSILFLSSSIPYKLGELIKITELNIYFNSKIKGLLIVIIERVTDFIILLLILSFVIFYSDKGFSDFKLLTLILLGTVIFSIFSLFLLKSFASYLEFFAIYKIDNSLSIKFLKICEYIKKILLYFKFFLDGKLSIIIFLTSLIWCTEILAFSIFFNNFAIISTESFVIFLQNILQINKIFFDYYIIISYSIFVIGVLFYYKNLRYYVSNFNKYNNKNNYIIKKTSYKMASI